MFHKTTLGELLADSGGSIKTGPFGTVLKAAEYSSSEGVPLISVGEVGDGVLRVHRRTPRVDEAIVSRLPEYVLHRGDIVFGRKGAVDRSAWLRPHENGYFLGSDGIRVRFGKSVCSRFMAYQFRLPAVRQWLLQHSAGTTMASLSQRVLEDLPVRVPDLVRQRQIAEVLGAIDDKIAGNERVCDGIRDLSLTIFRRSTADGLLVTVADIARMVTRGVAPKYVDENGIVVLNQKCVRDQVISLAPARLTARLMGRTEKILRRNDVVVNSTGQGTLGRVARWLHDIEATVDSHITIVRFDPSLIDPVCAGYALQECENLIEGLAEGSTGQTELRRDLLAAISIAVPERDVQGSLGERLRDFDDLAMHLRAESQRLAATRNELLPLIMSGRIQVRDSEKVVEEVV